MKLKKIEHNYKSIENLFDLQSYVKQKIIDIIIRYIEQNLNSKSFDILIYFVNKMPDTLIQIQNIYNVKKKIRHRKLKKYTSTQLLLKTLHRNN